LENVNVTGIAAGQGHSLALDDKGGVWAWGWNNVCQLGENTYGVNRPTATPVPSLKNKGVKFTAISAGGGHSLALDANKRVWIWGWNNVKQINDSGPEAIPEATQVTGLENVTAINAGQGHSIALTLDPTHSGL
jgi:alpha-tubulin suppressor-like RCC1 family protein